MSDKFLDQYSEKVDPSKYFTAEMGEYIAGSDGDLLSTEALGPCVGIAIFDSYQCKGYLLHTYGIQLVDVYDFLSFVNEERSDKSQFRAWVSGGQISREHGSVSIRTEVEELLKRFGIDEGDTLFQWSQNGDESVSMQLNTETGNCLIETTNICDEDIGLDYDDLL